MNCEQCKEQVFELIERETIDEAGVREVLERCPECRALFDELKATLRAMDQMPLEDPPAVLDAEILRAAAARRVDVTRLRRRRNWAPPWAMAAVALLAIGVGVWSLPRDEPALRLAREVGSQLEADEAIGEEAEADPLAARLGQATQTPEAEEPAAQGPSAPAKKSERPDAKRKSVARDASAGRLRVATPAESRGFEGAEQVVAAEAAARDDRADDVPHARSRAFLEEAPAADQETGRKELSESCQQTLADHRRQLKRDATYTPDPEVELALGRCYAGAGDVARARRWLTRAASREATEARAKAALRALPKD